MNRVTICFAYYRNRGVLSEQCKRFRALPQSLKDHLSLIVVDDGSRFPQENEECAPENISARYEDIGFPFSLYEIGVNVRWNQDAARNIAAHHAEKGWLLLTDIDHIPPQETLEHLVNGRFQKSSVYRFSRVTWEPDGNLTQYKPHPNSWFMTRDTYERVEGYDETFAGYYGTDADFRNRVVAVTGDPVMLDQVLIRVPRETIKDASTTSYERKGTRDKALGDLIRARNEVPGWHPKRLTFPYRRIA